MVNAPGPGAFELPRWDALAQLTIGELIDRRARQMPFRIALSAHSIGGWRDRVSYAQLALHTRSMGAGLAQLGVKRGERVAVFLGNDAGREAVLTALGCFAVGAIVVPMNVRSSDDELEHAFGLVKPALVVTVEAAAARLRRMTSAAFVFVDAAPGGDACWPDPARREPGTQGLPPLSPTAGDAACFLFTSGTTSRSKTVMHSHRSMIAAGFAMGCSVGLGPADLYQGAFPFFTSSCLNLGCMSAWVHSAGFVMEEWLDNAQRLRLIETECSTVYHGVPSVIQFMLDEHQAGAQRGLRGVRRLAYGGAAMPVATIQRIERVWPWMEQVQVWGMTESGPAGAWLAPQYLPQKAGSIGRAMPNCKLKVIDEAGREVTAGELGELCFQGPSTALGYYDNPDETAKAFRDGWLHTGDLVVQDQDGFLRFVDRRKDVINRGGLKISSAAVEAALYRFPGVQEAAAIAVPHPRLGEDVAACVVAQPGANLDVPAMQAHCARLLAEYEVPRHWFLMEALPKNPMGKILKRELRTLITERSHSNDDK